MALWRKSLFPLKILFGSAVFVRKSLYECGMLSRYKAPVPTIAVGNISTGGTGKTPMVDYLLSKFSEDFNLGMLSRGYGRTSKGYCAVTPEATAGRVGDEPLLLAQKHPNVKLSVCEKRPQGIQLMLKDYPNIEAFILDDALQHLPLQPSFKIVLTTFQNPWFSDALLPVGNLREPAASTQQADVVVVTKCPATLNEETKNTYKTKLGVAPHQKLFFTTLEYDTHVRGANEVSLTEFVQKPFVLLTGIANPSTLVAFLNAKRARVTHRSFADHHRFSKAEITALANVNQPILTTEKDAVRLAPFGLKNLYTLGVRTRFLADEKQFLEVVRAVLSN
ncbi:MAG: tetraacyldisaccharide 4'-kinase [Flavobacteriaceae bacterium]